MPLTETVVDGTDAGDETPGSSNVGYHAQLHIDTNVEVNDLRSDFTTHSTASTDAHGAVSGTSKVTLMAGGGRNIYVQGTTPTAENVGDIWIDTSV